MLDVIRQVLDIFERIPDTVWAAVTASLITLGGVWLTNRNSRAQQILFLTHDANVRDKERMMSLRRDIYLPVAEAIANSISLLTKQLSLTDDTREVSQEFYS